PAIAVSSRAMPPETIHELLKLGADEDPALGAAGRAPLTYRELRGHVARTMARLNEIGVGRNDAVAIVLPNGPEMASEFVAIGAAAVLASAQGGASVHCTPGFDALHFFRWLEEVRPTWYTGVPTMHQAILGRAARNAAIIESTRLRLVRSSSASLPPQVMAEIEKTFNAPVVEAYGMTEAAHQMASNPLPPRLRKPGSVGLPAGPEVAVMDEAGKLLPAGAIGELVIRGANVTKGYKNNTQANATAFTNGWFRTGDQGVMDTDGYFRLTGRLKEIINRGGEKISPREVDEVLLDHPAVAQVVTFGVPHAKLGEDVAACIVLAEGAAADEQSIRAFAATRLADFKVPRTVVFVAEIPKGATGKLQRIGLAQKLGLA